MAEARSNLAERVKIRISSCVAQHLKICSHLVSLTEKRRFMFNNRRYLGIYRVSLH